jgi:hypothetical protein
VLREVSRALFSQWKMDRGGQTAGAGYGSVGSDGAKAVYMMADIDNNYKETMLEEILHLHFTRLKYLNLANNLLQSIEPLCRVQMPHIENLSMGTCLATEATMISHGWASSERCPGRGCNGWICVES